MELSLVDSHVPSHFTLLSHVHVEFKQRSPGSHACPQAPQLCGSPCKFAQVSPQTVKPKLEQPHIPPLHAWAVPHALPHPPQLAVLTFVSTQVPLHSI